MAKAPEKMEDQVLEPQAEGTAPAAETHPAAPPAPAPQQTVQVQVEDKNAIALYANFCRVTGSPEELIIDFGLNPQPVGIPREPIEVKQRIIVNYFTAKRLLAALQMSVQRHEAVFGVLETDIQKRLRTRVANGAGRPSRCWRGSPTPPKRPTAGLPVGLRLGSEGPARNLHAWRGSLPTPRRAWFIFGPGLSSPWADVSFLAAYRKGPSWLRSGPAGFRAVPGPSSPIPGTTPRPGGSGCPRESHRVRGGDAIAPFQSGADFLTPCARAYCSIRSLVSTEIFAEICVKPAAMIHLCLSRN